MSDLSACARVGVLLIIPGFLAILAGLGLLLAGALIEALHG